MVLHFRDPLLSPKSGDIYRESALYYVFTFRAGLVVLHFRDPLLSPKSGDIIETVF